MEPNNNEVDENEDIENDEEGWFVDLINIYILYYKKLYNDKNFNLFEGIDIDQEESTNKQLELFYKFIKEYDESSDDNKKIYNIGEINDEILTNMGEIYILVINGVYTKFCKLIVPLFCYVNNELNYYKENWNIIHLIESDKK